MASLFIRPIKHAVTTVIAITYLHKVISGEEKDLTKLPDLSLAEIRDYYRDVKTTCSNTFDSLKGNAKAATFTPSSTKFMTDEDDMRRIVQERLALKEIAAIKDKDQYRAKPSDHHNLSPEEIIPHDESIEDNVHHDSKSPKEHHYDPETPNMND